jgi:fluoroquinolone transport system ATP-binding protein
MMMIHVTDLTFTYPKREALALKGLNFSVETGEIFGFLGPSGAGKSTTQKILIGLLKQYGGQVSILGRELNRWGSDYYEQIGVGFELPNHYLKLTARENLDYFRSLYRGQTEDPQRLLELVGLGTEADTLVSQFSKGMRMRLNFVRALLHKPSLLFLDEPTSGLDPVNARLMKDIILQKKAEGTTIFLSTHDMTVADELCDRVAFITDGEILALDSPKAMKLRYGQRTVRVEYTINGNGHAGPLQSREFNLDALGDEKDFWQIVHHSHVQTIHSQEPNLERVFIEVTGRRLS